MAKGFSKNKKRKPVISTKSIVILKIVAAGLLFFSCSLFFFQHMEMFLEDLMNFNPFCFLFFAGVIVVCIYGANLAGHIEDDNVYLADRYDWVYKLVVTVLVVSTLLRRFLYNLSVPVIITVLFIFSGLLVLIIPKIVDNNNEEF